MRKVLPIAALCALPAVAPGETGAPSFARDVFPIFARSCNGCHSAQTKMGGLDLENFDALLKGGSKGPVLAPGKSSESRLYTMVAGKTQPVMPLGDKRLPAGDVETIRAWIDAGAKPPAPGEIAAAKQNTAPVEVKPKGTLKPQSFSLAWHPSGKLLAMGGYREVRLADPSTGRTIATLGPHAETVRALAFSSDGKLLAAGGGMPGKSGELVIWDVESRKELRRLEGHSDNIFALAFSPQGNVIATSSYDKLIKLWDSSTGKEVRTLKDHIDAIYALAFTPDGKRLISGAADRTVKVWDVATGERLFTMSEPTDGVNTIAIDPAGKMVAAGGLDKTIRIWALSDRSAKLVNSLIAHEDAVLKLAWAPDGVTLVSSAADRSLKVFRTPDLTELHLFERQPDWVYGVAFSPDGKSLAAARFDGTLAVYDAASFRDRNSNQRAATGAQGR